MESYFLNVPLRFTMCGCVHAPLQVGGDLYLVNARVCMQPEALGDLDVYPDDAEISNSC